MKKCVRICNSTEAAFFTNEKHKRNKRLNRGANPRVGEEKKKRKRQQVDRKKDKRKQ